MSIKGKKRDDVKLDDILRFHQQGFTKGQIAKMLHCSPITITTRLKLHGLNWHDKSGKKPKTER